MYRDVNGKTGMSYLRGNPVTVIDEEGNEVQREGKLYVNMKLYSPEELVEILADGITKVIPEVKPQPTQEELLEKAKENKKRYIMEARNFMLTNGMTYMGHKFQTDEFGQQNIREVMIGLAAGFPVDPEFTFRSTENIDVPMNQGQQMGLGAAWGQHKVSTMKKSWQLKAQVDAANTVEEINGVRNEETGEVTGGIFWTEYDELMWPKEEPMEAQ